MTFTVDMKRAVKNIKGFNEQAVRGSFLDLAGRIIKATPVGNPSPAGLSRPHQSATPLCGLRSTSRRGVMLISYLLETREITLAGRCVQIGTRR
jgi:hypothetical protein